MVRLVLTRFESPLSAQWQSQQIERFGPGERARLDRLSRPLRREQFVVGHAVLRHMLSAARHGDATIEIESEGRTQITAAAPVHASIAHSGTLVAVALASERVGVDIEAPRALRDACAAAALMNLAAEAQGSTAVIRAWVAREAQFKAGVTPPGTVWRTSWEGCELAVAGTRNAPLTCVFRLDAGLYNAVDLPWQMCVERPVSTPGEIDVRNPVRANRGQA